MADASFNERLKRIEMRTAHHHVGGQSQAMAGWSGSLAPKQATSGSFLHTLIPTGYGTLVGLIDGVFLAGLTAKGSPWGPGTALGDVIGPPALSGLVLAPLLVFLSLYMRRRWPSFFHFSLGFFASLFLSVLI